MRRLFLFWRSVPQLDKSDADGVNLLWELTMWWFGALLLLFLILDIVVKSTGVSATPPRVTRNKPTT